MKKWIHKLTKVELVLIYLVILAGSIVRMTGSGMGCPDWPKCFGYIIPPTHRSQLEWQPHHEFKKGQIIIVNESLRVAQQDFTTSDHYDEVNWAPYTKHNYAEFNPFHTWTEYINRLCGALSGIPMFFLVIISGLYVRQNWRFFVLSLLGLFLLGFEAWLGKLVVDGNLIPGSITIHMMSALTIVTVLLIQIALSRKNTFKPVHASTLFKNIMVISLLLTLFQIAMGTQVREQIDILNEAGMARNNWISNLNWEFYFHRSFASLILLVNAWLWWYNRKNGAGIKEMGSIMFIILLEIAFGITLTYAAMPEFAQPVHLVLGTFLFGFQLYAVIRLFRARKISAAEAI